MSYIINKTDGTVLTTILDGTTNTNTGLTLIGRNYTSYGQVQNDNFVRLLENFADTESPDLTLAATPLTGTLWWNTNTTDNTKPIGPRMYVYNGAEWIPLSERTVASTAPSVVKTGDQWWDSVNQQLNVWSGTAWILVGPTNSAGQGKSGVYIEEFVDVSSTSHQVITTYSGGTLISVQSTGAFNLAPANPNYALGFGNIVLGINISSTSYFNGTANNAITLDSLTPSQFARVDQDTAFGNNVSIAKTLSVQTSNISVDTGHNLLIKNTSLGANIVFSLNTPGGYINGLTIDNSGNLIASSTPVIPTHVTNKQYVDNQVAYVQSSVTDIQNSLSSDINQAIQDYVDKINQASAAAAAATAAASAAASTAISSTNTTVSTGFNALNSNVYTVQQQVTNLDNYVANLAPVNNPTFTGYPSVPTPPAIAAYFGGTIEYQLLLSHSVNTTIGQTITQYNTSDNSIIATWTVAQSRGDNQIVATLATGSINQSITNNVAINGTLVSPPLSITNIAYLGPNLTYNGLGDNSSRIAPTAYVDITANILHTDYNNLVNAANAHATTLINSISTTGFALNANPTFSGTTYAPTPNSGDNSNKIATTAFVSAAVAATQVPYTVSQSVPGPSDGVNGQVWFVVG